ncbi:hypothetical protein IFM89_005987 [Coptis chinensis]|uniref:WW domain-containing protein n=1 Tax=Coptis chinensis TaxID=261450 RepID=A0A835I104_9MAGN|nr:hypothetical protein IFM89_005987 [Coptis chinensis]
MGKRKERRAAAAASMGAGRRVKLDLFAEPPSSGGENKGVVVKEEEEEEEKNRVGVPNNSPSSSSGKRQENPLLLLGQYSDDDAAEEPSEDSMHVSSDETSRADQYGQIEDISVGACGNVEDNIKEGVTVHHVKQEELCKETAQANGANNLAGNKIEESGTVAMDEQHKGKESTAEVSDSWTSGMQIAGDVVFGWKLVMHEETNQYYYWNVETGETSWEVPAVFAQGTEIGTEQKVPLVMEEGEIAPSNTTLHWEPDLYPSVAAGDQFNGAYLVSYAESLIQRLKDLERSDIQLQGLDWMSKCISEIEIRLSDFNSLLAYGSSLLPFWIHSEEKLKVLELAINDHVSRLSEPRQATEVSLYRGDSILKPSTLGDSELTIRDEEVFPTFQNSHSSPNVDTRVTQAEAEDKSNLNDVNDTQILSSVSLSGPLGDVAKQHVKEVNETGLKSAPPTVEDEDMDVDMEVDDEPTTSNQRSSDALGTESCSPPQHFIQPDPPDNWATSVLEKEYDVPPLPDEDWIPPPPPDSEPIPPPPPDDPPAPTYTPQPPYTEVVPHIPYTEQYISYPVAGPEYYGSMITEVPNSIYYTQSVDSQPAQYFDMVPTTYSETTSVIVNPINPLVYYNLPEGTVPPGSTVNCFESSAFYNESGPVVYHDPTADQTSTLKSLEESESSILPNLKGHSDALAVRHETEVLPAQIPPPSTTIQATITSAPVPLTTGASGPVALSINAAKASAKVLRSKKRTLAVAPTLRSNKKVSSLVDKWKAAKEELQEDEEDEPQNAYEMLERKRQREIEEWRARQIATGEAKDNANFQPLGSDWRERVKRRRSKSTRESVQTQFDALVNGKHPPDLTELSKDLPSGWQAYWDESSKKAYYGNTITSETTWTKPTDRVS